MRTARLDHDPMAGTPPVSFNTVKRYSGSLEPMPDRAKTQKLPPPDPIPLLRDLKVSGWKRSEVAKALGVDPVTVTNWAHGHHKPRPEAMAKIVSLHARVVRRT